jgi:hypothetical protein
MKRYREEQFMCDDSGKKITSGKILYHCTFPGCKFIACTQHNIEHHMRMKHIKHPQPTSTAMSDSSFANR